jgi:hypothetical protein
MQFTYPTSSSLMKIEQDKMAVLRPSAAIAKVFPEMTEDSWLIAWEQLDNYAGLMQPRGLNNAPLPVKPIGIREMVTTPGVYSDMLLIDERKLTTRRQIGTYGTPADVSDLVTEGSDQLASRDFSRVDYMCWTLLQTGTYSATDRRGVVVHQIQYAPQTYNAGVGWGTTATATPLADFRTVNNLGGLGTDARFDASAVAYMTRAKYNQLISNTNAADLGGRRDQYGATYNNLGDVNRLFLAQDLPQIEIVQDGFFDDVPTSGTYGQFVKYLLDNKVVVVGKRPTGSVGRFYLVKNVNNPTGAPGRYFKINDLGIDASGPRRIELHRGHNSAPVILFPRAIYVMNV